MRKSSKITFLLPLPLLLASCMAGKLDYMRPMTTRHIDVSKIINKPRDAVWNAAVPALGKQFFVINNMDRSSGFINLRESSNLTTECRPA
jgi:hypothetical protein